MKTPDEDPAYRRDPTHKHRDGNLSIRTLPGTEAILQTVIAECGLTFWGQAASMIFDHFADHPAKADLEALKDCPPELTEQSLLRGKNASLTSRALLTPLSRKARRWLRAVAKNNALPVERAASLVLYRNAQHGADAVLDQWKGGQHDR